MNSPKLPEYHGNHQQAVANILQEIATVGPNIHELIRDIVALHAAIDEHAEELLEAYRTSPKGFTSMTFNDKWYHKNMALGTLSRLQDVFNGLHTDTSKNELQTSIHEILVRVRPDGGPSNCLAGAIDALLAAEPVEKKKHIARICHEVLGTSLPKEIPTTGIMYGPLYMQGIQQEINDTLEG